MKEKKHVKIFSIFSVSLVILLIVSIFTFIVQGIIKHFDISLFMGTNESSLLPKIITTFFTVMISLGFGLVIGIMTAIYIEEYIKSYKIRNMFHIFLSTLNGIPSIIFGLFGYSFFVLLLNLPVSVLVGSLTLGIMILPTVIFITSNALKNIDSSLKQSAYALGGSKWEIIKLILLNEIKNGILNALVLSLAKILGESAALLLTMGTAYDFSINVFEQGRTLASHMLTVIKSDILTPEQISQTMYTTGFMILVFSAVLIIISEKVLKKGNNNE